MSLYRSEAFHLAQAAHRAATYPDAVDLAAVLLSPPGAFWTTATAAACDDLRDRVAPILGGHRPASHLAVPQWPRMASTPPTKAPNS